MLAECWSNIADGGPTFSQQRANMSCLLEKYNHDNSLLLDMDECGYKSMRTEQSLKPSSISTNLKQAWLSVAFVFTVCLKAEIDSPIFVFTKCR